MLLAFLKYLFILEAVIGVILASAHYGVAAPLVVLVCSLILYGMLGLVGFLYLYVTGE